MGRRTTNGTGAGAGTVLGSTEETNLVSSTTEFADTHRESNMSDKLNTENGLAFAAATYSSA
jgi:hypothetical protein